jgi:hypothetical protein
VSCELGTQVKGRAAGQEEPAEHGSERRRGRAKAEVGGDGLGGGVGLLRGESALLDREGRCVACGVDARDPRDAAIGVDRQEPAAVGGQARKGRTLKQGNSDDDVGAEWRPGFDVKQAVPQFEGAAVGPERDATGVEHRPQCRAGGGPEEPKRIRLRCHDGQRCVRDASVTEVDRGHHRELVYGQRPRCLGGDREDQPSGLAALERVEDGADLGDLRGTGKVDGTRHHRSRHCADSEDQGVVRRFLAAIEQCDTPGRIRSDESSASEVGALIACDGGEVTRTGAAEAERPGDGRGAVDEGGTWSDQLDGHLLTDEVAQREQRLDRGDTPARDDDSRARRAGAREPGTSGLRHGQTPRRWRRRAPRAPVPCRAGRR